MSEPMNSAIRILNAEPQDYSQEARVVLKSIGTVHEGPLGRGEMADRIGEYDVLIVRFGHRIDRCLLERAKRLKVIVTATTGLDHIDTETALQLGIKVLSLKGERAFLDTVTATAEHTWGLLLSLVRHVPASFASVCRGEWDRDQFKGYEIRDRVLGVIGYGRLGTQVARYGLAFGMRVLACDPHVHEVEAGVGRADFNSLLRQSDIVTLHVPVSAETRLLIRTEEIAEMRPRSWLINTSRGVLVDEAALLNALQSGHLAGAALDVLAHELSPDENWVDIDPLVHYARTHNNLIITGHLGGATWESMHRTELFMAEKLRRTLIEARLSRSLT